MAYVLTSSGDSLVSSSGEYLYSGLTISRDWFEISRTEGNRNVGTPIVYNPNGGTVTWAFSGTDVDDFFDTMNDNGYIQFDHKPNYEGPRDADGNNDYNLTLQVDTASPLEQDIASLVIYVTQGMYSSLRDKLQNILYPSF